ncbi:MAG: hypothetical protein AB7P02_28675 [Alphaproteobacteria bacterium]
MGSPAASAVRRLNVGIAIDAVDAYQAAWDGPPVSAIVGVVLTGNMLNSPPDPVLCVVRPDGRGECLHRIGSDGTPFSDCPDSLTCEWTTTAPQLPFGVVLFDLDVAFGPGFDDLIDAVIVAEPGTNTGPTEAALRELVAHRSRTMIGNLTILAAEERRRSRNLLVLAPDQCRDGCRLHQSTITFSIGKE